MYTLRLKRHEYHIPDFHDDVMWAKRLVKNERFWAVVALVALVAILIMLGILAGRGGGVEVPFSLVEPF